MTVNVSSAALSLTVTGTYAGTLTFNAQLAVSGNITFIAGMTLAGTTGPLVANATSTLTSGGKTVPCPMTFGASATYTLADSWTVTGLVTAGVTTGATTINGASKTITCNGGLHQSGTTATIAGTAKFVIGGGTFDSSSSGGIANAIDLAGTVTVSGTVVLGSSAVLTYVSGTITTTGSTITSAVACTFNTAGVTWNNLTFSGAVTYTISSGLAWSGTTSISASATFSGAGGFNGTGAITLSNAITVTINTSLQMITTGTLTLSNAACTFAGNEGFIVGTLTTASLSASRTYTLTNTNSYQVTSSISNVGTTAAIRQAIVSSSAGNKVPLQLVYGGTCDLLYCDPTDVDSSGGAQIFTARGTVTTSLNWTTSTPTIISSRNLANMGGGGNLFGP